MNQVLSAIDRIQHLLSFRTDTCNSVLSIFLVVSTIPLPSSPLGHTPVISSYRQYPSSPLGHTSLISSYCRRQDTCNQVLSGIPLLSSRAYTCYQVPSAIPFLSSRQHHACALLSATPQPRPPLRSAITLLFSRTYICNQVSSAIPLLFLVIHLASGPIQYPSPPPSPPLIGKNTCHQAISAVPLLSSRTSTSDQVLSAIRLLSSPLFSSRQYRPCLCSALGSALPLPPYRLGNAFPLFSGIQW